jgi:ferredoxin-NADP reductase
MKAKFVRKHHEAANIISFWFEPEWSVSYLAGQFTELSLPHKYPDERGSKRWFTLSSSPTDALLISITTKFAEKSSTFKTALKKLKPGAVVDMAEPMGDFVLPKDSQIPLVFVAGGIGITPFHSIVKWLNDIKQERDITFIYSVANKHEMVFQDLFEHYGLTRHLVVGERLTGQKILELVKPADDALIYTSGPEPMVEALQKQLEDLGIGKSRLVGDFFPGYTKV